MGKTPSAAISKNSKKKKKGRPSLLDIERRSLRLERHQQQQHENHHNSNDVDLDVRPKEKQLRNVLKLSKVADSPEDGKQNSAKATDYVVGEGEPPDQGPTTPLPDKKLLIFILDGLQKRDTYGVFSEPPDAEELPDYYDIIKYPMDFGTVRKKLDAGVYRFLEQFEEDVYLISSNAMTYNSPDTIYHRQARSIQELAKKNFENLRQESDDSEQEPKIVARRGRPPIKSNIIEGAVMHHSEHGALDSSIKVDGTAVGTTKWINSSRLSRKDTKEVSLRASSGPGSLETSKMLEHKSEDSGSALKEIATRSWKKASSIDENRRNTYKQPQAPICPWEQPIFSTFLWEKKLLVPIGLQSDYGYARSLARFAEKLGPIAWETAAKRIQRALPPGTKFGPGWIHDQDPQKSQQKASPTTIAKDDNRLSDR